MKKPNLGLIPAHHPNLKVMNITHLDLDGVGCSASIRAILPRTDFLKVNYGRVNPFVLSHLEKVRPDIATVAELESRNGWGDSDYAAIPYDLLIISDISPENVGEKGLPGYFNWHEFINDRGHSRNIVILDHHETANAIDGGNEAYADKSHNFIVDSSSGDSATKIVHDWCRAYSGKDLSHLKHVISAIDTYDMFHRDTDEFKHTSRQLDYMFSNWWQKFSGEVVDGIDFSVGEEGKKVKGFDKGGRGFGFTPEQDDYIFRDFINFLDSLGHSSSKKRKVSGKKVLDFSIDPIAVKLYEQFDSGLERAITDIKRDFIFIWDRGIYVLVHGDNGSFINHVCDHLLHEGVSVNGTAKTFDFVMTGKTGPFSAQYINGIEPGKFGAWGTEPDLVMTSGSCRSKGTFIVNKTVEEAKDRLNKFYAANGGLPSHTYIKEGETEEIHTVLQAGGGGHEFAGGWSCIVELSKFPKKNWGTYGGKPVPSLSPVALGYVDQVAGISGFGELLFINPDISLPEKIIDLDEK